MSNDPLIVRDLNVAYETKGAELPVLRGLNLTITAGQTYGLVGESGCGKSTAAYAIARYLPANGRVVSGSVSVDGEDVLSLDAHQLRNFRSTRLAMVYQEPGSALNPTMRIGDQIAEVHVARGVDLHRARALAVDDLRSVALPATQAFARRYPHELSGGQQQRVVIAMALAVQPRLLVLDEPTTGLDATVEAGILDLVQDLKNALGFGVLLISHNLPLVARTCDRVGVLYAGRLVEEGPAAAVLRSPSHPYTGGLLRCVPRIDASKGSVQIEPIQGRVAPLGTVHAGCVFVERCAVATGECHTVEPDLEAAQDGAADHTVRCFHPGALESHLPAPEAEEIRYEADDKTLVQIENLAKHYGKVLAFEDVNLTIGVGEVLGLVGESGSGKTSLGRSLAGLTGYRGTLRIDGAVQPQLVEKRKTNVRRELQMVFQQPDATLNPKRTVAAILRSAIRQLRGPWTVRELTDRVDLDPSLARLHSGRLSGGQKQRVAIARAFAGRPKLVICDEPVSALDVSVQAAVLKLLRGLQRSERVSYLFISHDLGVVRYLSDRIAVMYRGHIVETGTADAVFNEPAHPYTEMLLAAVPRLDDALAGRDRPRVGQRWLFDPAIDSDTGCRFANRCPYRIDGVCDTQPPPWRTADAAHQARCHLPIRDLRVLREAAPAQLSRTAD